MIVALLQKITMLLRFCLPDRQKHFQIRDQYFQGQTKIFPNPWSIFTETDTNISKFKINICRDATNASLPWKAESILSGDLFAVVINNNK